jgi:multidrug resistance efflux pump
MAEIEEQASRGQERLAAEIEHKEAEALLHAALKRLESLTVAAPRAGTVVSVTVHPGDAVWTGTPLLQIADATRLLVEVPLTAGMARSIRQGSPVVVRIPGDPPHELNAAVDAVVMATDRDHQSYSARILIDNPTPSAVLADLSCAVEFGHGAR